MTQELLAIPVESLLESVRRIQADGYRLVQICCTRLAHFELSYSFDKNHEFVSLRLAVPFEGASVPSISAVYPNAFIYENEIHDLFGVAITGISVDYAGKFYRTSLKTPFGPNPSPLPPEPARQTAAPRVSGRRTVVPFGPQHPVLPEPIHLDLVMEDEKVVEAVPSIGFIHRGLERLVEKKDFVDYVYVAERICGICSFIHGLTYCLAVEEIMKLEVPPRARYLRVFWSELSRLHSHLLWLGLLADAFGFESLFMQSWRLREQILDIIEATTGGRVIFGSSKVGGVRRDVDSAAMRDILRTLEGIEAETKTLVRVFLDDKTVRHRLVGVGVVGKEDAYLLGAVGPTARASGLVSDMRSLGYSAYNELQFSPVVRTEGDSFARCAVRADELFQSFDLIRQVAGRIPDGPIDVKVTGTPSGEFFARTEQPRGEVIYYAKSDGSRFLQRLRVRTPTFANIPPLLKMLPGCSLADVPVLVLTIDPCISCAER